jgi:ABC-type nitrate/sulfonate/bicarbonate transport system substrate-binding protein
MQTITLAYRDNDRTPVIFAIREMARQYYDLDVNVVRIKNSAAYEAALFDGSADVIIEHLEYLYAEAAKGNSIAFFCAPSKGAGLALLVPQHVHGVEELRGRRIAVRSSGQRHAVTLWLKMLGLEKDVATVLVDDQEVGRWGQWKKVASGDCIATFMSPLYLLQALAAGLTVLPTPEIPIIGHFAQACLAEFARNHSDLMRQYVKSILHALVWLTKHSDDTFAVLTDDLRQCIALEDDAELRRRFDSVVSGLKIPPYPTTEAITNTYAIATMEYPGAIGLNPLALWDLHWVKELDDEGFIAQLLSRSAPCENS